MADIVRNIGLSLGADLCWPACYEHIMRRLDLHIPHGSDTLRFEVERVTIEPFDLEQDCKYDVVIDRLTHWFHTSREWIKKSVVMNDLYVFNNPWSVQSMEKHTAYSAMMHLGMPVPKTWLIPPKAYQTTNPDLKTTLNRYAKLFDLGKLGPALGYPMFVKPYDGGGWRSVVKASDEAGLRDAYEKSGADVMHVQAAVHPYDAFVRSIGFGPQVKHVSYDPEKPLHDRYMADHYPGVGEPDFETLRKDGVWHPMDFANACPDSQVTSLHRHFPWLVKAYIRWSVYCAATKRPMRRTLDWDAYYEVAKSDRNYAEKLDAYAAIADERFETARFEEWCAQHLSHLDEVANDFFGSNEARDAVMQKVAALFPAHEIDSFTELFWQRIQEWRKETV